MLSERVTKVDIVYLIDTSSSMAGLKADLDKLALQMDHVVQTGTSAGRGVLLRSRVCGFRLGLSANSLLWQEQPFTEDRSEFLNQVHHLEFGDAPAAPRPLLGALLKLSRLSEETDEIPLSSTAFSHKRQGKRFVTVLTDSPCLMVTCTEDVGVASFEDVASEIMQARLRLLIVAPEHDCYDEIIAIDRAEWFVTEGSAGISNVIQDSAFMAAASVGIFRAEATE
jgi:hypothetical protein